MKSSRLILFAMIASLIFCESNYGQQKEKTFELRILSYNIHHGEGVDRKLDLERIAGIIKKSKADLVALQEVDVKTSRTNNVDQAVELAKLTGMNVAFGPNIEFGGGKYGNAVLSKHKIVTFKNQRLPNHDKGEQRGLLRTTIEVKGLGQKIEFFSTHFDHRRNPTERIASANFVNENIQFAKDKYYFMAGDFNDVIGSDALSVLQKKWSRSNENELPTVPVNKPTRQIDFVFFAKGQKGSCIFTRVLAEAVASDHRAVLALFEIPN